MLRVDVQCVLSHHPQLAFTAVINGGRGCNVVRAANVDFGSEMSFTLFVFCKIF